MAERLSRPTGYALTTVAMIDAGGASGAAGYVGLFAASFVAATLVPLGSEALVAALPARGYQVWLVWLIATTGNVLGAFVNYYAGRHGAAFVLSRWVRAEPPSLARAGGLYRRWGAPALFFSWLPLVGDPLTLLAGAARLDLRLFAAWVTAGKALRYLAVLGFAEVVLRALGVAAR